MGKVSHLAVAAILATLAAPVFAAVGTVQQETSKTPMPLQHMQNQFCHALAPAGWSIVDQGEQGDSFSLASPSRNIVAAYVIAGFNSAQVAGKYGPQYTSPPRYAQHLASTIMGTDSVTVTGTRSFNGMQIINFAAKNARGFAMYRIFPSPSDKGGFVMSVRMAIGSGMSDVSTAGAVAASINCMTAFKPPQGGYAEVHAKSAETGISQRCKSGDCADADLAGTYNSELGAGYVHSASGTNYLVDPAADFSQTGPDGPGYYRQAGNKLEKLVPGRVD